MGPSLTNEDKTKALTMLVSGSLTLASMAISGGASAYLTGAAMLVKAAGEMAAVMSHQSPAVEGVKADMQGKVGQKGGGTPRPDF